MNWGTKLVLGMSAFMLFIVAMVVYMFSVHGNDALVDADYYEKGINYDQEYKAKQNVIDDRVEPVLLISPAQIIIQMKDSAKYELKIMRPSTVNDDVIKTGKTVSERNLILIDRANMPTGLWFLEIEWVSNGKSYLFKSNITL